MKSAVRTISVDATLALKPIGYRPLFRSHHTANTNPLQSEATLESWTVLPNMEKKKEKIAIILYSQSFRAAYCPHLEELRTYKFHLEGHEICTSSINSSSRWGQ
jgi:hypothetical protein